MKKERADYVDIGPRLVESDGTISPKMMPDYLHPTEQGYQIWMDAIQPLVNRYDKAS